MQRTQSTSPSLISTADERVPFVVSFSRGRKILITSLIACYFGSIAIWNMFDCPLKAQLIALFRIPVDLFAFEQTWNMFAPGVRYTNYHLIAVITFADGSSKLYEFPRMEMMDALEKYRKEKMRKLFIDNIPTTTFDIYLPDICASMARANYDKQNPPTLVTVSLHQSEIPTPNESNPPPPRFGMRQRVQSVTLIVYKVRHEDLESP